VVCGKREGFERKGRENEIERKRGSKAIP